MALQAAKVREAAQREAAERERAARQAEMETVRQRRESFMETLLKPALKRHRRNRGWSLAGIWLSGFYLFSFSIALVPLIAQNSKEDTVIPVLMTGVLAGWGLYACIKSRRRNSGVVKKLENERVQYEAGIGRYNELAPEKALAEFVQTVQTILIQKWSRPLAKASLTQISSRGDNPVASSQKASDTIDVFLSYEHSALTSGWLREFVPLLVSWLKEGIGREPSVFNQDQMDEFQSLQPETLEALTSARCFLPILTPSYLRSESCLMELRKFIELNRPILPIVLHPLVGWPDEFQNMAKLQVADFTEFIYIGEGFTKTEQYVEFQRKLRMFAQEVTKSLIQREFPNGKVG